MPVRPGGGGRPLWALLLLAPTLKAQTTAPAQEQTEFTRQSGLFAIVTGMEHSGTTILSRLLECDPSLMAAFECGLLLAETPSEMTQVKPFYEWLYMPVRSFHWGVPQDEMPGLMEAKSHSEMYQFLRSHSPIMSNGELLVDKTPRYVYSLPTILARAPDVPVIIMRKSHEVQRLSYLKRHVPTTEFERRFSLANASVAEAQRLYPDRRMLVVDYEELMASPGIVMTRVFAFLGLEWKDQYLTLDALNEKWARFHPKAAYRGIVPSERFAPQRHRAAA